MNNKLKNLFRMAVLGTASLCLPMYGQYSTPMRDINDPGRTPFQTSATNVLAAGDNTPVIVTSVPAGSAQRLVIDFLSLRAQGSSTIPVTMHVFVNGSATIPDFELLIPLNPVPTTGQQISIAMQSLRFYVSAGQTLSVFTLNQGSQALFLSTAFTGHYVTLP